MADPTGFAATTPGMADPGDVLCPLLAVELAAGTGPGELGSAGGPSAAAAARCTATSPAPEISAEQRRLVCEDAGHLDCPRYVRAMKGNRGPAGTRGSRGPAIPVAAAAIAVGPASPARTAVEAPAESADDELAPATATPIARATVTPFTPATATPAEADARPDDADAGVAAAPTGGAGTGSAPGDTAPSVGDGSPTPVPVRPITRSSRRSGARPAGSRPVPIVMAGGIVVVCLVIAFVFTSLRGGLALPGASPAGGESPGVGLASPTSLGPASIAPSPSLALVSPSPEPTPTATASPTPAPTASLPAAYAGLKPCPGRTACYLYRIRPGDSLTKVADRFGLTLAVIKKANPEIKAPSLLHVGDVIRVPLPKR